MRVISLTEDERQELELLLKTSGNSVIRERCSMLMLSDNGLCVNKIAAITHHTRHTVSRFLNQWERRGAVPTLDVLSVAKGRGARIKLAPVKELLPELVEKHSRNLKPILAILEKEYSVTVSKQTLQNFLKEAGI
jgi:transposase